MSANRTVLICDDALFMRTMVKDILQQAGFEIVGEAETGIQAVEKYKSLKPALVTMDIVMPEMGGIDAVRRSVCAHPDVQRDGTAGTGRGSHPGWREGLRAQAVPAESRARSGESRVAGRVVR